MTFEVIIVTMDERGRLKQFCRNHELQMERLDASAFNVYGIPDDLCDEFTDFCEANHLAHKLV